MDNLYWSEKLAQQQQQEIEQWLIQRRQVREALQGQQRPAGPLRRHAGMALMRLGALIAGPEGLCGTVFERSAIVEELR